MTPALAPSHVAVDTPDGQLPAQLWVPPAGTGPGLVLVQEIFGVSAYIQQRASDLAELGYVVLAPELYWRLDDATIDESRDDVMQQAMALAGRTDWDSAVADVRAALVQLRTWPQVSGGVGLIGFCYGGGLAFSVAALEEPDVLVSYYGSSLPGLMGLAEQVTAPSLHHFGTADAFIPGEDVQRIKETLTARPNVVFELHEGANHAFDNHDVPALYHAEASATAWNQTVNFLARELPTL
jgi:carboxymethylenebutenolidase